MSTWAKQPVKTPGGSIRWKNGCWHVAVELNGHVHRRRVDGPRSPATFSRANRVRQDLLQGRVLDSAPTKLEVRRWPAADLMAALGCSIRDIAAASGRVERTGYRWANQDQVLLSDLEADAAAIRLGSHPAEVWSLWGAYAGV